MKFQQFSQFSQGLGLKIKINQFYTVKPVQESRLLKLKQ